LKTAATNTPRLYQRVAERLSEAISSGQLAIGDRLPAERELSITHNVSRATVREAIIALEHAGLVEAKMGSGVYVTGMPSTDGLPVPMDVGPFELTEARMLFEGEVAALAATQITDLELAALDKLLIDMDAANKRGNGEEVDRQFHQAIANATRNRAMASVVESLWTIRLRSPQCVRLFQKSRARGTQPVVAEHRAILSALRAHDAQAARVAMRQHLKQVLDYLLDATESEAMAEAKAKATAQRNRYTAGSRQSRR
jgi:GntR family transcriptional regulator, hexuronate regulon transcriptional repressor